MLRLQRNRADVLQLYPAEVEDINNTYSQKRKDVTMSATTTITTIERKMKQRGERGMKGERKE